MKGYDVKIRSFVAVVPALFAADRLTKYLAFAYLRAMPGGRASLIDGLVGLRYAENTGAAFSFFSGRTEFLTILTAFLAVGVLLYIALNRSIKRGQQIALWAVFAGGVGNLYDRIFQGYIVDFIELQFMNFAIFNVADICITVGAVAFCLLFLLETRAEKPEAGR